MSRWTIGITAILLTACASHPRPASIAAPSVKVVGSAAATVGSTAATVSTAASQAPDCRADQLGTRFVGGGYGGGSDFGAIVVWNPGPTPCRLHGAVGLAGYYRDGSKDLNAGLAHPIAGASSILSGGVHPPRDGQDLSGYLTAQLMGTERDDASQPDALCRKQDEGTPATLALTIGPVTVRTANSDPGSVQVTGVYGCHGRVLLEALQAPSTG